LGQQICWCPDPPIKGNLVPNRIQIYHLLYVEVLFSGIRLLEGKSAGKFGKLISLSNAMA